MPADRSETARARTGDGSVTAANMPARLMPTRDGRWGIRQYRDGEHTGGGTVGMGWATEQDARDANPPIGTSTFEPFDRWPDA